MNSVDSVLLPALDFMHTHKNAEFCCAVYTAETLPLCLKNIRMLTYILPKDIYVEMLRRENNLQRGGSDYTASLIGAAINADEIEIWTDIDGMHTAMTPVLSRDTAPVHELHFEEAAELAYFGAKILHPTWLLPAPNSNILFASPQYYAALMLKEH